MSRIGREEPRNSAEHSSVGDTVEGGIVERAEDRRPAAAARDNSIQHIKDRREPDYPAGQHDVPGREGEAAGDGADRPDRRENVRIDPEPYQKRRHRLDEPQVALDYRLPDSFHRLISEIKATGPRAREW